MQLSSENMNKIELLCGSRDFEKMPVIKSMQPFDEKICAFLAELSSAIMKNPEAKGYPDVVTFGFFCRKSNINTLRNGYGNTLKNRLGKGVTFHIAPSNVPINFAYSLVSALLAGNCCIVRASSKKFQQVDIVCSCMKNLLEKPEFKALENYINVVRYPHSDEINAFFSSICDVRVIWGGDSTIEDIRRFELPPRSTEITFADRYSAAVIDAKTVLEAETLEAAARDFYNDTYLYDQNACSSPRLIYWLGSKNDCEAAAERFWSAVHSFISEKYTLAPVVAVDKYCASMRMAIDFGADIRQGNDNLISRIRVDSLDSSFSDYRCAGGSFIEYSSETITELSAVIDRKTQTLSYFGADREMLAEFVINNGLSGIDRIVPMGKTADFAFVWDGYDLIMQMSRAVSIR